jgi:Tol biopolymer transport system component
VNRWLAALLIAAMVGFGVAVNRGIALLKTTPTGVALPPTEEKPRASLPGTIYLAQKGSLYRFRDGAFTQLSLPTGYWQQPAVMAAGSILAVQRGDQYSDLYLLTRDGHVVRQLTHNAAPGITSNHWAFYPQPGADASTVYYSSDSPKNGFRVDFAIWRLALAGGGNPHRLTTPNDYTGGDVVPLPLPNGGLLYSDYGLDEKGNVASQLVLGTQSRGAGTPLTTPADDCGQPAISRDAKDVAMVCTGAGQQAKLERADFNGSALSGVRVLVQGVQLGAPAFSPDRSTIAYLAPAAVQGRFQLWTVTLSGQVRQITDHLDLDATSPPAWSG